MQSRNIDVIMNVVQSEFLPSNVPPPIVRTCTGWLGTNPQVESQCNIQIHER